MKYRSAAYPECISRIATVLFAAISERPFRNGITSRMHWSKVNEFVLPLGIIGCLLVFFVPLPGAVMDVLLAANIAIGLVVLLTTLYVRTPLEFSVFPTVLLATTLARLVLNVATTRLILTRADTIGLSAAGNVIEQFGKYVSGDRLIVGFVIFAIIFVIQMLVITKGATRISEVAARFSLDGIPGRQLAIDADLNAGVIDQKEAQLRREQLNRQADFFGAMDGASKFVRGDAIAGLVITVINIVGGLSIGLTHSSMSLLETTEVYTTLTIGDGLVSQIPALLISLSAALLVTRGSQASNLPVEFLAQLFSKPQVMAVAGVFLGLLVFTELPSVPLGLLAVGFVSLSFLMKTKSEAQGKAARQRAAAAKSPPPEPNKGLGDFLHVDALEIELGRSAVAVASSSRGGDLLARIKRVRERVASDLGLMVPSIRVRDNLSLADDQYVIKMTGNVVASERLPGKGVVVIPPSGVKVRGLRGAPPFTHPALDGSAKLIPLDRASDARASGCNVVSPSGLIAMHLQHVVYTLAHELLTRDATMQLIEETRRRAPTIVDELIPDVMKLGEVQQVLRGLLREGVPIRQLASILEALGDHAPHVDDTTTLTEIVRKRLARTISARYRDADGLLHVVTLDSDLESQLASAQQMHREGLSAPEKTTFREVLSRLVDRLRSENRPPVLLTNSTLRRAVVGLAQSAVPGIVVLARDEVSSDSQIRSVGIVALV